MIHFSLIIPKSTLYSILYTLLKHSIAFYCIKVLYIAFFILYKSILLSAIKVPYESVLLSIITCRHLSLTYHTQKYLIKAFYYLEKSWLYVT